MNMQDIGLRISALRKQRDMTQLELADKMGVSYQAVSSWERGSTMPDISRLPEISQILAVSIDELLSNGSEAEIVKDVLTGQASANTGGNQHNIEDIVEVAPVLKPSQMETLVDRAGPVRLKDLAGLAPFISKDLLKQLALKAHETGDLKGLSRIAPFLDKETLNQLAVKIENVGGIGQLSGIAPFVSKHVLAELAAKAVDTGSIQEIKGIAPFLDKELLGQLIMKATGYLQTESDRNN